MSTQPKWPVVAGDLPTAQHKAIADWQEFAEPLDSELPQVIYSPYRICPLGAHLDHQFGPVLAGAIDHGIHLAYMPVRGKMVLRSDEFFGDVEFKLGDAKDKVAQCWANYARGAVFALQQNHVLEYGLIGVTVGGRSQAGMSSSAAVGIAYLKALASCNNIKLSDEELVRLDKVIETNFLGLKNGILDPAAVVFGRDNALAEINTRNYSIQHHQAGGEFCFALVHSGLQEALTPANFNLRVDESLAAAQALNKLASLGLHDPKLGDIPVSVFAEYVDKLEPILARRAQHFFSESERVKCAVDYWQEANESALGELMRASSLSSMNNYECGAGPVRDLVTILNTCPFVWGARFCGPGFRGCSLALVKDNCIEEMAEWVLSRYTDRHSQLAEKSWVLKCRLVDGAHKCKL